jgi:hypothetical protein
MKQRKGVVAKKVASGPELKRSSNFKNGFKNANSFSNLTPISTESCINGMMNVLDRVPYNAWVWDSY